MEKISDEIKKNVFESIQELKKALNHYHKTNNKSRAGASVHCICGQSQTSKACDGLKYIKMALNYKECKELAEYIGKSCL